MNVRFLTKSPLTFIASIIVLAFVLVTASTTASAETLAKGTFKGASGHVTTGAVTIEKRGATVRVILGSDFTFDGAPDPKFAFAKDGELDTATIFAALKSNSGQQVYELPASIDPADYDQFVLWCEEFSVPLGSAKLR